MNRRTFFAGFLACALSGAGLAQDVRWRDTDGADVRVAMSTARDALASGCGSSPTSLCLRAGRFLLEGTFVLQDGSSGVLTFDQLTDASGVFYFKDLTDAQGVIKVLDVCGFAGTFWIFLGGLTDQEVHLRVTDTYSGSVRLYDNALKNPLLPVYDFAAFNSCAAGMCSYALASSGGSFTSGGGSGSVNVVAASGCAWNAISNASFLHVQPATHTGTGNGAVNFTVDANTGSARSGTLTVAGLTFTVSQAAAPGAGSQYDGSWSGTSTQGKAFTFTVVNGGITVFRFGYDFVGSGCSGNATTEITYSSPRLISGNSFTISGNASPNVPGYSISGTFTSSTQLVGTFSVSTISPPCANGSGSGSWSANKQ